MHEKRAIFLIFHCKYQYSTRPNERIEMLEIYTDSFNQDQCSKINRLPTLSQGLPNNYIYRENGVEFGLVQIRYPEHIELLHRWMNMPHVIPQWQLNKSLSELSENKKKMLADDHQRLYLVSAAVYRDLAWHLFLAEGGAVGKGFLVLLMRLLSFFIFEHSPAKKIVGEPDASVKPYEIVAQELNYMPQYQIVMPEKTAMLYFCDKEGFYCKFAHYLNASIKE